MHIFLFLAIVGYMRPAIGESVLPPDKNYVHDMSSKSNISEGIGNLARSDIEKAFDWKTFCNPDLGWCAVGARRDMDAKTNTVAVYDVICLKVYEYVVETEGQSKPVNFGYKGWGDTKVHIWSKFDQLKLEFQGKLHKGTAQADECNTSTGKQ